MARLLARFRTVIGIYFKVHSLGSSKRRDLATLTAVMTCMSVTDRVLMKL